MAFGADTEEQAEEASSGRSGANVPPDTSVGVIPHVNHPGTGFRAEIKAGVWIIVGKMLTPGGHFLNCSFTPSYLPPQETQRPQDLLEAGHHSI